MNFFLALKVEPLNRYPAQIKLSGFLIFFSAHQLALFHKPGPNRSLYQLTGPFKDEKDTH